jgi:hypothetical protein
MQNSFSLVIGGFAFTIVLFLVIAIQLYNEVHYSKYKKLMAHLREHHLDIYEQIRIKPILGPLYAKGAFKISIDYAKKHPPTNDPIAEKLFSDYAEFSQFTPTIIGNVVKDAFQNKLELGFDKHDIAMGIFIGMIIGVIVGGVIGYMELPVFKGIGIIDGAVIGLLGGIVGGFFGAVREFGWQMKPIFRSLIGAILGSICWIMVLPFFLKLLSSLF